MALVLAGFGGAVLVTTAVGAAEEGVYSEASAKRVIEMGSAASILVLGGLGAFLFTMRRSVSVDPETSSISVSWTALGIHRRRALPVDPAGVVAMAQRGQPTGTSTIIYFAVDYVHPDGRLELTRLHKPMEARAFGARIAAACGRPLLDTAGDRLDLREAAELDGADFTGRR